MLAWLAARETGMFAMRTLDVEGASPRVSVAVSKALTGDRGTSLLKLDLGAAGRAVEALPTVAAVSFDRAFPHTLRILVVPEHPVAVVRQGPDSYLVSARGRVMGSSGRHGHPKLARIWVRKDVPLSTGSLAEGGLLTAVTAVAPLAGSRFPGHVISVTTANNSLTMTLRSGLELRFGEPVDVGLKLAVAAEVIPRLAAGTGYLDVAVPDRPVAGTAANPKL